jgi:hypothetical protein
MAGKTLPYRPQFEPHRVERVGVAIGWSLEVTLEILAGIVRHLADREQ